MTPEVNAAVEGDVDEAVLRALVAKAGGRVSAVFGKAGKGYLKEKIGAFNHAATHWPWVVLVDLDHDAPCPPEFVRTWVPARSQGLCFRVAVREVESWLLADRRGVAGFLGVPEAVVPADADALDDPKSEIVRLATRSRRRDIREDMAPRPGSRLSIGPLYSARLIEFVTDPVRRWDVDEARARSSSLERSVAALGRFVASLL